MMYLVVLSGVLIAAVVLYSIFNKKWDTPEETEQVAQDVLPQKEEVQEVVTEEVAAPIYVTAEDLAPESTVTVKEAYLAPTPALLETKKEVVKKKPAAKKASVSKKEK